LAISRKRKEELVDEYAELLKRSRAVFLADYQGLNVKQITALRAEVHKVDGAFLVTKNTLLALALERAGHPVPKELLLGQLATGFALNEAPSMAKALVDFAKDAENLVIKGAIMGDELLTAEQVEALARLPSRDELRAQILGLISAPARNLAATVASGVRQVVNVLDAYAKQEESLAEAEATA
jgi:large subunit ribosomal protein L10